MSTAEKITCAEAQEDFLGRGPNASAAARSHVAGCGDCAKLAEAAEFLSGEGERLRRRDLSAATIAATRRQAEALLAGQAGRRTRVPWPGMPAWRWAMGMAALVVAIGLVAVFRPESGGPVEPDRSAMPRVRVAGAGQDDLDDRIDSLGARLEVGVAGFRRRYTGHQGTGFEGRTEDVRARIALCSSRIRQELAVAANGGAW